MFKIALSREALKYYKKVSSKTALKLDKCFIVLESDPFQNPNIKSLKGFVGRYRYKSGNLRIVYAVDTQEKVVYVIAILPRGQAYKHAN